jgi:SAM-dependent methyltransferase
MSLSPPLFPPLLRTLAAVPVSSQVLDLGCGSGVHTEALLRLGFPVHACDPDPDAVAATRTRITPLLEDDATAQKCVRNATLEDLGDLENAFDWVVVTEAHRLVENDADLHALLTTARRVLKPGGWMYLVAPASTADQERETQTAGDGAAASPAASPDLFSKQTLEHAREDVGLALSAAPEIHEAASPAQVHAIYRHVTEPTPS